MRFENMILMPDTLEVFEHRYEAVEAQHDADMAYEVACPLLEMSAHKEAKNCFMCALSGRVTLGGIVAADMARR